MHGLVYHFSITFTKMQITIHSTLSFIRLVFVPNLLKTKGDRSSEHKQIKHDLRGLQFNARNLHPTFCNLLNESAINCIMLEYGLRHFNCLF